MTTAEEKVARAAKGEATFHKYLASDENDESKIIFGPYKDALMDVEFYEWECSGRKCGNRRGETRKQHIGRIIHKKKLWDSVQQHFATHHEDWHAECFPRAFAKYQVCGECAILVGLGAW